MAGMYSANMNVMMKAAEKAARVLLRDIGEIENLQVSKKGPGDFVTAADKRCEQILQEELQKARPKFGFLMEEGGEIKGEDGEHRWIIDPIDGTMNFLHGLPGWCISIALERNDQIIAGLIYDPIRDDLYRAEKGTGAYSKNRRMRVSERSDLGAAVVSTWLPGIGYNKADHELYGRNLKALGAITTTRCIGSAALELAYTGAGKFDAAIFRNLKPWDLAAGTLIVKEAGGCVIDLDNGKNPVYGQNIFVCNQPLRSDLERLFKSALKG